MRVKLFLLLDMIATAILSAYVFQERGDEAAVFTGLSVLIALSPICLILSSPFVMRIANKILEDEGIKVNKFSALMTLPDVDTVAMPLNRFLTDGDYFVTDLVPEGLSQSALLALAATGEQSATHPLGKIIYDTAVGRALKIQAVSAFNEIPGRGVEALVNNTTLRVGSPEWIKRQKDVSISASLLTKVDQLSVHGKIPLIVSLGNMARGIIALKDEVNLKSREFVSMLKRQNLETVLLTASNKKTAKSLAKNFSLDSVRANLSPEDKAREILLLRAKGNVTAVIANEFHDLPAMINSDVSVLLKDGSLIPLNEDGDIKVDFEIPALEKFLILLDVAARAEDLIKTNRRIAFLSWIVLVPPAMLTALENSPIFFHPAIAITGVLIFSMLILINSLRMRKKDF